MPTLEDLPASAVRLITRAARTRRISGTNRFARVCRAWRDATIDSEDQEQLQLLLALEGLPADTLATTSSWLTKHGACVTSQHIIYDRSTAALFKQLPLSSAPLVNLARLEVDGPDSLIVLAPVLPQLVALTHLRASMTLAVADKSLENEPGAVNRAQGVWSHELPFLQQLLPEVKGSHEPPCLQQLCPGLKSLRLDIRREYNIRFDVHGLATGGYVAVVAAPVEELLPAGLEQLHIRNSGPLTDISLDSAALTSLAALRCLSLVGVFVDPDPLFVMPVLDQLDLRRVQCLGDGVQYSVSEWLAAGVCTAPQQQTKLTGMTLVQEGAVSGVMQSLVSAAPGLRKLGLLLREQTPEAAAWVQQLSSLGRLRHLDLTMDGVDDAAHVLAVVSALSSLQQLTYLRLNNYKGEVQRSTWAQLLPHLPQLRVLGVRKEELLAGGLAAQVAQLTQLQCLYVECEQRGWDPDATSATSAEVAPHLPALSKCSSLRAVLCWSQAWYGPRAPHIGCDCLHHGGVHCSCWDGWRQAAEEGWVVSPRACPHLPGVWELQQQE